MGNIYPYDMYRYMTCIDHNFVFNVIILLTKEKTIKSRRGNNQLTNF